MATDAFQPGLLRRLKDPPRKVVLLRASRIGDFICATPAFRALRSALPQAEITMVTLPMLADLAQRSPHLDRFVPFPGFPGIAEQFFEPRKVTRFFFNMQQEDFDLAIQMQGSGVNSNPFSLLLGAKATAGFIRPEDLPGHLDAALPLPEQGHEIERVLALVEFLGVERQGLQTEFPLWEEDCQQAEILLEGLQPPLIGLHPAARDLTRRWPAERFAKTAKQIQAERGGTLVCIGDSETRPTAEGVLHAAGGPARNLAGVTSLGALGAVIKRLSILITNDSGPAHIAYALGTPTVTIFGGDEPQRYGALMPGPFRMLAHPVPCRPCNYSECPIGYICLEQITPDQVVRAAFEVMR